MAGLDSDIQGEARPMPDLNVGYWPRSLNWIPTKMFAAMLKMVCAKR